MRSAGRNQSQASAFLQTNYHHHIQEKQTAGDLQYKMGCMISILTNYTSTEYKEVASGLDFAVRPKQRRTPIHSYLDNRSEVYIYTETNNPLATDGSLS